MARSTYDRMLSDPSPRAPQEIVRGGKKKRVKKVRSKSMPAGFAKALLTIITTLTALGGVFVLVYGLYYVFTMYVNG